MILEQREPWMDAGACNGQPQDPWFPERGESLLHAKRVCATCPVAQECLDYALARNIDHGVWGGTSEKQRRQLRRNLPRLCATGCGAETPTRNHRYCEPCAAAAVAAKRRRSPEVETRSPDCIVCGSPSRTGKHVCGKLACVMSDDRIRRRALMDRVDAELAEAS